MAASAPMLALGTSTETILEHQIWQSIQYGRLAVPLLQRGGIELLSAVAS